MLQGNAFKIYNQIIHSTNVQQGVKLCQSAHNAQHTSCANSASRSVSYHEQASKMSRSTRYTGIRIL